MGSERTAAADDTRDPAMPADPQEHLERRILEFERAAETAAGARAHAVRSEFGVTLARYHQMLSAALDSPTALRYDPILVRRLRRLRDARTAARAARTFRLDTQETND